MTHANAPQPSRPAAAQAPAGMALAPPHDLSIDADWQRFLYEQAHDAVFAPDRHGQLVQANASFARLLGYPTPSRLPLALWDWDLDHPHPVALALLAPTTPALCFVQSRWRKAGGNLLQMETRMQRGPVDLASGQMARASSLVFCCSRDIIAQHRAHEALRASEHRRSWALAASHQGRLCLRFAVHDSGVGVSTDRLASLFNAFEQADVSTTRRHGGTGLGLAITHRLAQLMGGEVGADSVRGQGSCFWFTGWFLHPADGAQPQEPASATTPAPGPPLPQAHENRLRQHHAGAHVLLVEDNRVNQEVAMSLLQAAGLRVQVANNGLEAVGLAGHQAYHLILMDMQMPVMDGLEATRAIRRLPAHARTPILAMTADAFGDDRLACLAAGMDDHLAKPVDPALLYAMLGRWLARAGHQPQASLPGQGLADGGPPARLASHSGPPALPPAAVLAAVQATAEASCATASAANIPGLITAQALLYLPGRDAVFQRVLRQFAEQYQPGMPALRSTLASQDWPGAMRHLHSLRGACGAIGAIALSAQALALEQALQPPAGTVAPPDCAGLLAQADTVLAALGQLTTDIALHLQHRPGQAQA